VTSKVKTVRNLCQLSHWVLFLITGQLADQNEKERKSINVAPFCTKVRTWRSGMDHTVLPANNTMPDDHWQCVVVVVRSTPPSRPNNIRGSEMSVSRYVRSMSVSTSVKFGM